MKFFLDTADVAEIRDLAASGLVDGVTTNPSLVAKSGRALTDVVAEICEIVDGPISAEVLATDTAGMLKEAEVLSAIARNVVIKLPLTMDGLKACRSLSDDGIMTNVTLCFSANQALMAAKAGATFVSPFVGRLDDVGSDGMDLIEDILTVFDNYLDLDTQVLVASVRHPQHVYKAALLGADAVTMPPAALRQLVKHPLTDNGLAAFIQDAEKAGLKI
jgi:transaldolase